MHLMYTKLFFCVNISLKKIGDFRLNKFLFTYAFHKSFFKVREWKM